MIHYNLLPFDYAEIETVDEIVRFLQNFFDDSITFISRPWMIEQYEKPKGNYIVLITSSEGHKYIPKEQNDPNCMGVFMHYPPVEGDVYTNKSYTRIDKLHHVHLGCKAGFKGVGSKPIKDRKYDITFIGQLDPYRRIEFYNFCEIVKSVLSKNSLAIHFYNGWNKGFGEDKYSEIMSNTKIALVPSGSASLTTFRWYEAYKCGCSVISEGIYEEDKMNGFSWGAPYLNLIKNILSKHELDQEYTRINNILQYEEKFSPIACAKHIVRKILNDRKN